MAVASRAGKAFADESSATYANDFLKEILANWRDAEKDLRRTVSLTVLLAVAFELVNRGGIAELTIGFAKVTKLDLIQKAVPAAVAYLTFVTATLIVQSAAMRAIHDAVLREVHPQIYAQDLGYALTPSNAVFYSNQQMLSLLESDRSSTVVSVIGLTRLVAILAGPVAFEVYAFSRLLSRFGGDDLVVVASLVVTVALFAAALATFVAAMVETNFHD